MQSSIEIFWNRVLKLPMRNEVASIRFILQLQLLSQMSGDRNVHRRQTYVNDSNPTEIWSTVTAPEKAW